MASLAAPYGDSGCGGVSSVNGGSADPAKTPPAEDARKKAPFLMASP
jgi:hypothetical protein